jgi:putative membrane protein
MIRDTSEPRVTASSGTDRISVELASRRTGLSFQRTRLSADRTLMSVIRTAIVLIGVGFAVHQFLPRLQEPQVLPGAPPASHNFGVTLIVLGVLVLGAGMLYHVRFLDSLRKIRAEMTADGLVHGESGLPGSLMLITAATLLLLFGLLVVAGMIVHIGPFA